MLPGGGPGVTLRDMQVHASYSGGNCSGSTAGSQDMLVDSSFAYDLEGIYIHIQEKEVTAGDSLRRDPDSPLSCGEDRGLSDEDNLRVSFTR